MAVERKWSDAEITSDSVSKREVYEFIKENGAEKFLSEQKLMGSAKNVLKSSKKEQLIVSYNLMFEKNAFVGSEYDVPVEKVLPKMKDLSLQSTKKKAVEAEEEPKYKKIVLQKGDKINFPKPGDKVQCYYIGKLADGTVFDKLQPGTKKKPNPPLRFNVGKGHVIKGWDQALLKMSQGEKAEITIEPEWAYGKQGKPEAKIPPNATLIFEVHLLRFD